MELKGYKILLDCNNVEGLGSWGDYNEDRVEMGQPVSE